MRDVEKQGFQPVVFVTTFEGNDVRDDCRCSLTVFDRKAVWIAKSQQDKISYISICNKK